MTERPTRIDWLFNNSLWQIALIAYWLVLFAATHVPQDFPAVPIDDWDKVAHFSAYAILGGMLATTRRLAGAALNFRHLLLLWIVLVAYGAFDEWTQPFVGREADVFDWVADAAGAAAGLALIVLVRSRYMNRSTDV
jgi:VanZ family protein